MIILYTATIFLSAFLIFLVQPIIGKLLLPLAGGSSSVWNTCMLFFQTLMLAGYCYTHISQKKFGVGKQTNVQLGLMLAALLLLPITFTASTAIPENPTLWLLINLFKSTGIPFFVLATLSPMLQLWFAHTNHKLAGNPFFLYAASNTGSFAALLAYPFLIEPFVDLATQTTLWAAGYAILTVLIFFCRKSVKTKFPEQTDEKQQNTKSIDKKTIIKWVVAAFIPSSLLMGSTLFITTDIAPVPLLWILPLMIFLITFIIAFSPRNLPFRLIEKMAVVAVFAFTVAFDLYFHQHLRLTIPLHLLVLFSIGLYCHSYLARSKPAVNNLTAFYAWISVGGMLGGVFNTLVAPYIFIGYTEYPLIIVAAAAFIYHNSKESDRDHSKPARLTALATGVVTATSIIAIRSSDFSLILRKLAARHYFEVNTGVVFNICEWLTSNSLFLKTTLVILIAMTPLIYISRIKRFNLVAAVIGMMLCFYAYETAASDNVIFDTRNFFGIKKVSIKPESGARILSHGSTNHGAQISAPAWRQTPLTYYHRQGPAGDIFALPVAQKENFKAGIIGLGVGTLATYAKPGNEFTFYEIDPDIIDMVSGEFPIFSFICDNASQTRLIAGDGRLKIKEAPANYYDLILLDAFSSDAIPMHLITNEAVQTYLQCLQPDGVLALHVTNRYLNLLPVLKKIAEANDLKIMFTNDFDFDAANKSNYMRKKCIYVVMARSYEPIIALKEVKNKTWQEMPSDTHEVALWSDSFSSIIPILKW